MMLSKSLKSCTTLIFSGILLGSIFTTESWGMMSNADEEEKWHLPTSREIKSEEDLNTIWKKDVNCISLSIQMPSEAVNQTSISFWPLSRAYPNLEQLFIIQTTMGGNEEGQQRMHELTAVLRNNNTIKTLSIVGCHVDDQGATDIAAMLLSNKALKNLHLDLNDITDDGVQPIGTALTVNRGLKSLSLVGNKIISVEDAGTVALIKHVYEPTHRLQHLSFDTNNFNMEFTQTALREVTCNFTPKQ